MRIRFFFRRGLLLALLICLMPCGIRAEQAGRSQSLPLYSFGPSETALSIAAQSDGSGYLLTSEALFHFSGQEEPGIENIQRVMPNAQHLISMALAGDHLFFLNSNHEIMRYDKGELLTLSLDNAMLQEEPLRDGMLCLAQNQLYYIYSDENGKGQLVSFNLETKTYHRYGAVFDVPWCAWDMQEGRLLGIVYDESRALWQLAALSGQEEQVKILFSLLTYQGEDGICYDAQKNALYLPERTGILRYHADGSNARVYGVPHMVPVAMMGSGQFVGKRLQQLRRYEALEKPLGSVSVLGHRTQYSQDFTQKTGIAVQEISVGDKTVMQWMAEAMVTQDASVDLFTFESSEGLQTIKDKRFFADLSQSEVLRAGLDRLYPAFSQAVINQERQIVAWPIVGMPSFRMAFDQEALDYGVQTPATWDEMLDAIQALAELDFFANETYVPFGAWTYTQEDMMAYLQRDYLINIYAADGDLSFDTPIFRHLAQRILDEVPKENLYPRRDEYDGVLISGINSGVILEGMLPPMKIAPQMPAKIHTWTKVFVLNPYAEHKEEAIQYLEYLATKQTAEDSALYRSMNQPIPDFGVQAQLKSAREELAAVKEQQASEKEKQAYEDRIALLEIKINGLYLNRYLITQKAIDEYQAFSSRLVVLEDALIMYNENLAKLSRLMVNDGISLDEFIRQADSYIQLVRMERGR
jgi:ABC-type glycerol-3-phosphate transport system substrate-binding protein